MQKTCLFLHRWVCSQFNLLCTVLFLCFAPLLLLVLGAALSLSLGPGKALPHDMQGHSLHCCCCCLLLLVLSTEGNTMNSNSKQTNKLTDGQAGRQTNKELVTMLHARAQTLGSATSLAPACLALPGLPFVVRWKSVPKAACMFREVNADCMSDCRCP